MLKLHLKDCGLDIKGEINRYMTYLKQKPGSLEDVIAKQQSPYQESAYQDKFKKELVFVSLLIFIAIVFLY